MMEHIGEQFIAWNLGPFLAQRCRIGAVEFDADVSLLTLAPELAGKDGLRRAESGSAFFDRAPKDERR